MYMYMYKIMMYNTRLIMTTSTHARDQTIKKMILMSGGPIREERRPMDG